MPRPFITRGSRRSTDRTRGHRTRRYDEAQLTLNCLEELRVIADYRRSQEAELLHGRDS